MAKKRTCLSCKKEYEYCPNCGNYSKYPKWMTEFCSEECKDVFNVISQFNMGLKTKEDINNVIRKHNISDFGKFSDSIQKALSNNSSKTVAVDVVENVIKEEVPEVKEETPIVENVTEEAKVEEPIKNKFKPRKRRNVEVDSENNEAISAN